VEDVLEEESDGSGPAARLETSMKEYVEGPTMPRLRRSISTLVIVGCSYG
jgi:hypothetical protein